jgi:hypothetical protein
LDLAAAVLPKLHQPHALTTCWPLLSAASAQAHSRWLPLCVLVMQAAASQHGAALLLAMQPGAAAAAHLLGVDGAAAAAAVGLALPPALTAAASAAAELLAAVKQHVRLAARRPQMLQWPTQPKWTVQDAAAELAAQGFELGAQGTAAALLPPQLPADATPEARAAAMGAWQQHNSELLVQERQRLAAALLLQQRLPVLLHRRRAMHATRQQLADWSPWLAQLHGLLGELAGEAAAMLLTTSPAAAAAAAGGAACTAAASTRSVAAADVSAAAAGRTPGAGASSIEPSDGLSAGGSSRPASAHTSVDGVQAQPQPIPNSRQVAAAGSASLKPQLQPTPAMRDPLLSAAEALAKQVCWCGCVVSQTASSAADAGACLRACFPPTLAGAASVCAGLDTCCT